ncbi:hypothetical protein OPV22_014124 [Ensete ventricosum]|uniref:Uncharacterized protein n=1 Tax=Ensete ventricosum TaxID=4639 RepID=A0AAV8R930_ENSVE|nr:hypothetical protein OPV22_014124 [Ensete ventricosum]
MLSVLSDAWECKVTAQRSLQKLWRLFLTLLAENAGLNPIVIVTEPRNRHAQGETNAGINVRKGQITNILGENVVQPLLVSTSAITLATKCVMMILKIDDIITVEILDWLWRMELLFALSNDASHED